MKRLIAAMAMAGSALVMTGCANITPQLNVQSKFWENRQGTVGIAQATVPAAAAHMEGQQGLLDIAINKGMAGDLSTMLEKFDTQRAVAIQDNFVKRLGDRGFTTQKLSTSFDDSTLPNFEGESKNGMHFAKKDYRGMKKDGVDRLLVIKVRRLGTARPYYGFIPLGGPAPVFDVSGQLIDLETNELLWNHDAVNRGQVVENWDAPPEFNSIVLSLKEQIEKGSTAFERQFFVESTTPVAGVSASR